MSKQARSQPIRCWGLGFRGSGFFDTLLDLCRVLGSGFREAPWGSNYRWRPHGVSEWVSMLGVLGCRGFRV